MKRENLGDKIKFSNRGERMEISLFSSVKNLFMTSMDTIRSNVLF